MARRRGFPLLAWPLIAALLLPLLADSVRAGRAGDDSYDWATWRQFWSFKAVGKPAPPAVRDATWVRSPIDAFVLAKLESKGLKPAAEADKYTLIRRATFDLTGLPPSPQEIRAFIADKSPDAYEKAIERLLSSPHYGEHWGRHWLDVARYTPGRITFPGVKNTAGDTHYRDYVVRAFNSDKPYDRFLTEQIAGDLLPPETGERELDRITAPAFLSIGAWFDMCTDPNRLKLEMVDEMVDATSKTFLGLSVACARCHDHKFDPIPKEDYYALGGIFRSTRLVADFSEFWRDGRVRQLRPLAMPDEVAANDAIHKRIEQKKQQRWQLLSRRHAELLAAWKADETRYRAAAAEAPKPYAEVFEAEAFDGQDNLRIAELMRDGVAVQVLETQTPTEQWVKYKLEAPQAGEYRLEALYSSDDDTPITAVVNGTNVATHGFTESTGGWGLNYQRWRTVAFIELRSGLNFLRLEAKEGNFPRLDRLRLWRGEDGFDQRIEKLAETHRLHPLLLAAFVKDAENPWPTVAGIAPYLDAAEQKAVYAIDSEMAALEKTIKAYPLAVAVTDQPNPIDLPVHVRGNTYRTSKDVVPRGVPRVFENLMPPPEIVAAHSGRLELAKWLSDSRHPLTSRVMANRIWHWHMGRGIVATPSDFGSRGLPPTHPELLDWLASTYMDGGWSMKQMHRLIMTSSTYRMSGKADAKSLAADPENTLLSRFERRRLEAEALYDSMVITTNTLVRQEPGAPLDVNKSKRRMMYVLVHGTAPKGLGPEVRKMYPLFDYELSGVHLAQRPTSATPAQSLFWMNSPLVRYFAERFAERLLKMDKLTDRQRVNEAYMLTLGRMPDAEINEQSQAYVTQCVQEGMTPQEAWTQFCLALYSSAEFHYLE